MACQRAFLSSLGDAALSPLCRTADGVPIELDYMGIVISVSSSCRCAIQHYVVLVWYAALQYASVTYSHTS